MPRFIPQRIVRPLVGVLPGAFLLALVLVFLLAQSASLPTVLADASDPSRASGARRVNLDLATMSFFGTSDTEELHLAENPTAAQLALDAGIVWERTSVGWMEVEPQPDQWNWAPFDSHIQSLTNNGLVPYVLILNNPSWAAPTDCGPLYKSAEGEFFEFVRELAARYDGDPMPEVPLWGLYNEPDNQMSDQDWGGCFGKKKKYKKYAKLASIAYAAIQEGNPNAKLVIGNVAYDNFTKASAPEGYPASPTPLCCFNYKFVDNLFAYIRDNSDKTFGDIFAFNNYWIYNDAYWEIQFAPYRGPAAKARAIRDKMAQYGLNFPLLIGEMGAPQTCPATSDELHMQAKRVVKMYVQARSAKILSAYWWPFADYPPQVDCRDAWDKGLVKYDLTPKPAYDALKVLTGQMNGWNYKKKLKGFPGIEGYVFTDGGGQKKYFMWRAATGTGQPVNATFKAPKIHVVSMYGGETDYFDNGSGSITIPVDADVIYVTFPP